MEISIILKKSEIMYDAMNETYLLSRQAGDDVKKSFMIQASENGDESYRLLNSMKQAMSEIRSALHFLDMGMREAGDDIAVTIDAPSRLDLSFSEPLRDMMHKYAACRILEDWLATSYPEAANGYSAKAKAAIMGIQSCIRKKAPTRP